MLALLTYDRGSGPQFQSRSTSQVEDLQPRHAIMEHRWGYRHAAKVPVHFTLQSGRRGVGRVLNISTTGAYLQTEMPLRILTLIDLIIDGVIPRGARFTGCVVRRDPVGVGLEWEAPMRRDFLGIVLDGNVTQCSNRPQKVSPSPDRTGRCNSLRSVSS